MPGIEGAGAGWEDKSSEIYGPPETAPGEPTINRLRKEVSDHSDGEAGMSKSAREIGNDPTATVEPAEEEVDSAAA